MLKIKSLSSHTLINSMLMLLALSVLEMPLAMAGDTSVADDRKTTAYEDSKTPVADSWITTKIKADFLADDDIKGLDINVSTTNGVVTLAGLLDSQTLVDKAVAVAQGTKGVRSVDGTTLKVKPAK